MSDLSNLYTIEKYTEEYRNVWNQFVAQAKNATFLFHRDFMEYHKDRFQDASLLVFKNRKVIGVLPASVSENGITSHQGLTYGGFVISPKLKLQETLIAFQSVLKFLVSEGIATLQLKLLPKIYHTHPADEIDYLLFLLKATRTRVDVSATIANANRLKIQSNRTEGVKKAEKQGLSIEETKDFSLFWKNILIPNLAERHGAKPVHSLEEIQKLAKLFPKNIKQYNVIKDGDIVAGATLFVTKQVAHVQYISANASKQQLGSLDFLFHHLITNVYSEKAYFDFGVSNENQGKNVNDGLQYWKECFGARTITHEFYEVKTANHNLLDSVFI